MASSIDNPRVATSAAEHFDGSSGSKTVSYINSPEVSAVLSVTGVFVDLGAAAVDSGYRGKRGHAEGDRYINIENLIGSDHVDRLYGDDNANTLIGGGSRDLLRGNGGNDILIGGAGQDQLDGHAGNDMLDGGAGADTFFGGSGTDTVTYADSPDENNDGEGVTLNLGDTYLDDRSGHTFSRATGDHAGRTRSEDRFNSIENLIGSAFADTFTGDANNNKFEGGGGDDTLAGGAGTNELYGGADDDTFLGGAGNDKFDGGSGSDTISYASSTDGVTVNLRSLSVFSGGDAAGDRLLVLGSIENLIGSDRADTISGDGNRNVLTGNAGGDVLYGGGGNDELIGGEGHDQMFGGDGDDMLIGGAGSDVLFGGAAVIGSTEEGIDTVSYEFSPDRNNDGLGVTLNLSIRGLNSGYSGVSIGKGDDAETDRVKDVENIIGSAYGDTLTGDENNNDLKGLAGDDILSGKGGNDTLVGGEGNDTLDGGAGADTYVFDRNWGADTIKEDADGGTLQFKPATGLDSLAFSLDTATNTLVILVGGHSVTIEGYANGLYNLQYDDENTLLGKLFHGTDEVDDDFTGTAGADLMLGLGGNDDLQGGAGMDRLYGGVGNDILEGGDNGDKFFGGEDYDTISYASSDDFVDVNLRDRTFDGGHAEGDSMSTSASIEGIIGSGHDDTLTGDEGVNTLTGGLGNDTLEGGEGDDFLEGGGGTDTYVFDGEWGADTIQKDTDGGLLRFVDAAGFGDFTFARADNNNVVITTGSNSVTIVANANANVNAYGHGRYTLQHGSGSAITTLGKLYLGTTGDDAAIVGSDEVDLIFGYGGVDTLRGGAGNDILSGGKHNDMLYGEADGDTLYGNKGVDRLEGGAGEDTLYGGGGVDTLLGGADADTLDGGEHDDFLDGGAGADIYVFRGDFGADTIQGEEGTGNKIYLRPVENPDTLVFLREANGDVTITHDSGSVRILAAAYAHGRYSIHYGDGNTLLGRLSISEIGGERIEAADDKVANRMLGFSGDDNFEGGGGDDFLFGGKHHDTLRGGAGDDHLYGQQGADRLEGGAGADRLDGGGGDDDTVLYSSAEASSGILGVTVNLFENLGEGSDAKGDTFFGVENVIGSGFADTLTGDEFANELSGGAGDDTLAGGKGNDTLAGGEGVDTYVFRSGGGADTIQGDTDGGNLRFKDATGASSFSFARDGDGNVIITVGDDSVKILRDTYSDNRYSIYYGSDDMLSDDMLLGRLFLGTVGDDQRNDQGEVILKGTGGANLIAGFQGDDILEGLAGNDMLYGGDGVDNLYGGADDDILSGGKHNDNLYGGAGDDRLDGGKGVDTLEGGAGADTLYGGGGVDTLKGGAGVDTLDGGEHDDILEGGAGADTYIFRDDFGADTIRGETDAGSELHFQDAKGVGDFLFAREDGGVRISFGDNSVLIQSYADGRYKAFVGEGESQVEFGNLYLAPTGGGDTAFVGEAGADWVVGTDDGNTLNGNEGNDILDGRAGADNLYGGADDDIISGGKHNDNLYGETGDDTLYGNKGVDRLEGGDGADTLYGGGGVDTLLGGADVDTLDGGEHDDFLEGGAGADTYIFRGDYGADTIQGDTDGGTLYFQDATSLDDLTFVKQTNGDLLVTHGSNSVVIENYVDGLFGISYGRGNAITVLGKLTLGTDGSNKPLAGSDVGDLLLGLGGDDRLEGGEGDDQLFGGKHHDTLKGDAGADRLYGGRGNDILEGGADADKFDGGGGIDTLTYENSAGGVAVNLGTNSFSRGDAAEDSLLVLGSVENLVGSNHNDELTGDTGENTLTGGAGADTLQGGAGDDILVGGAGADTYVIGAGAKRNHAIIRGDENDPVGVVGTDDVVNRLIFQTSGTEYKGFGEKAHGSGNSVANPFFTVSHDGNSVTISLNSLLLDQSTYIDGVRQIVYVEILDIASLTIENFVSGRYEVFTRESATTGTEVSRGIFKAVKETAEGEGGTSNGGAGRDYIIGSVGADIINGLGEDDFIEGGRGKDTIDGGAGADTIYGGRGADIIQGGSGGNFL